ncbi:MAG: hypothetical protein WC052_02045 [Patescibacteria group bacterium]|jgi:hypothetical protein
MRGNFFRQVDWSTTVSIRTVGVALTAVVVIAAAAFITADTIFRSANTVVSSNVATEASVVTSEGYKFSLPITWQENKNNELGEYIFENNGHTIRIRTIETVTTTTLIPAPATPVVLQNSVMADRYRDYDPATGKAMDRVIIPRTGGSFVEVSGYGPIFERLLDSFTFVN